MMRKSTKNIKEDDRAIGALLKANLQQSTGNRWFTRMVLNRLPSKVNRRRRVDTWTFLFCGLCIAVLFVVEAVKIYNSDVVYVKNFVLLIGYALAIVMLFLWYMMPLIRRC